MAFNTDYTKFSGFWNLADRSLRGGNHVKAAKLYAEAIRNWPNKLRASGNAKYQAVVQGLQVCRQQPSLGSSLREEGDFRPTGIYTRLYVNAALPENGWEEWVRMALANQMRNSQQLSRMLDVVDDSASMQMSWEYIPEPSSAFLNEQVARALGFVLSIGVEVKAAWFLSFTDTGKLQLGSDERPEHADMALVTVLVGDQLIWSSNAGAIEPQ